MPSLVAPVPPLFSVLSRDRSPQSVKVASGPAGLASSGASFANFANFTSSLLKLSPSLQTYVDSTLDGLAGATDYIEATTGLSPTVVYTAAGAVLLLGAIPAVVSRNIGGRGKAANGSAKKMSRYGWSTREGGQLSPFSSTLGSDGTVPAVTDKDFSYITSEDLESHGLDLPPQERQERRAGRSHLADPDASEKPVDDVLLIRNKGVIYPEHFPAYTIGDGLLLVGDVKERISIKGLSGRRSKRVKLLYKGRELKDDAAPIRSYGVKDNSEILVVVGDENSDGESSGSGSEEVVVVEDRKKTKKRRGKNRGRRDRDDRRSPDSGSNTGLEVPRPDREGRAGSTSRGQSPASGVSSAISGASAAAAVPGGPVDKINSIGAHFRAKLLPLCNAFAANPPSDPKKRQDEHRKISETVMQQVLLKLDEVETGGDDEARTKRRELVRYVQSVLKDIDTLVPSSS